jgi:hypothetical protein
MNPAEINPDHEASRDFCLRRDIAALMLCDTLALLDGWETSEGAFLEMFVARSVGIPIIHAKDVVE